MKEIIMFPDTNHCFTQTVRMIYFKLKEVPQVVRGNDALKQGVIRTRNLEVKECVIRLSFSDVVVKTQSRQHKIDRTMNLSSDILDDATSVLQSYDYFYRQLQSFGLILCGVITDQCFYYFNFLIDVMHRKKQKNLEICENQIRNKHRLAKVQTLPLERHKVLIGLNLKDNQIVCMLVQSSRNASEKFYDIV